ncbi:MAG: hypothetical protein BMS9Abin11_0129 [Gammaproteobacteria bacterium]|jgi:hypothetical protein|nr:MAG: hypothetical protein BMS9Abin11_0129 [Gammaproteobacteria bacterium]
MKTILIFLMGLLLLTTFNVYAEGPVLTIGLGKFDVTKNEIKKSVVLSLMKRGYKIQHISNEKYTATHHRKPVSINVKVSKSIIAVQGSDDIKPVWVKNIHKDITFWLEYYTILKRNDS